MFEECDKIFLKNKKRQFGRESYKNLPDDEKQRQFEYKKRYYEVRKKLASSLNKISGFSYKSKNATILGHSGMQVLAIRLDENAAILGHFDMFVLKEFK